MEITARKKSTDPVQEALRLHKDKWNLAAKEFINRMIAFKRGLNGRGDAHYSLPPGSIKEPLPSQVASFLNALSSNFEQLASEALKIEQEQASYSQNRRKPQKEASVEDVFKIAMASKKSGQIKIGDHEFETLLAVTAEEQEYGLMHAAWPPPVMSFVYSAPRINQFWMKNTPSPLDIVFVSNGSITNICKGEPHSTSIIGEYEFTDLVVELPYGTCTKLGIQIGDNVELLS